MAIVSSTKETFILINNLKKMKKNIFHLSLLFAIGAIIFAGCKTSSLSKSKTDQNSITTSSIYKNMDRVAKWQIDSIKNKGWRHNERDWTNGALYAGLLDWAEISKDSSYYVFMKNIGDRFNWKLLSTASRYHADNYCVGQMYCGLYERYHDPKMIADLKLLADTLIARPHTESLEWKNKIGLREWAWCDALFMAPPALAMLGKVTGEQKYIDLMDKLWWKTSDYLYDDQEHLYFRDSRYFDKKEKNGQKVFWSRGNGWVLGGLVRVLDNLPKHYRDKTAWVKQYKDMATKIASLQQADGTWHASLLDPASYPVKETSGTGFYCYALAWGVNNGILDAKTFTPVVNKAWAALVSCIHPNGMLGFAQPIGGEPHNVNYDDTEVYAVGAFLMAGKEMLKLKK